MLQKRSGKNSLKRVPHFFPAANAVSHFTLSSSFPPSLLPSFRREKRGEEETPNPIPPLLSSTALPLSVPPSYKDASRIVTRLASPETQPLPNISMLRTKQSSTECHPHVKRLQERFYVYGDNNSVPEILFVSCVFVSGPSLPISHPVGNLIGNFSGAFLGSLFSRTYVVPESCLLAQQPPL